ncbi:hypothetical protein ACUXV3_11145 [Roseobacteraceae bacterium NS-SX3]
MPEQTEYAGIAALTICEALLLAMSDQELLPEHEVVGILRDAAATHENAAGLESDADMHRTVAALINQIIAVGNWARRL